jgi:hypothetical protein
MGLNEIAKVVQTCYDYMCYAYSRTEIVKFEFPYILSACFFNKIKCFWTDVLENGSIYFNIFIRSLDSRTD